MAHPGSNDPIDSHNPDDSEDSDNVNHSDDAKIVGRRDSSKLQVEMDDFTWKRPASSTSPNDHEPLKKNSYASGAP